MRIEATEHTLPRLHLAGTLAIVVLLTLLLGGYYSWRSAQDHQASLARIALAVQAQQHSRLTAELDSAVNFLEFTRNRTEAVLKKSLREQVDVAMQVAQAIYDRESPLKSTTEVKRLIIEALRQVRFYDGRGYYFIDDFKGQFILLPTAPQLEGRTNLDNRDDNGHFIMRGLIAAAQTTEGAGYSRYRWYMPDQPQVMADKLAYVRRFAPYDWLIGTGDYTYKWEEQQQKEVIDRLRALQFGRSGYIGLLDRQGVSLLSPSDNRLEGQHYQRMPDAQQQALALLLAKARAGGGFVNYVWPDQRTGMQVNKTALVRQVEPWGWVLVATLADNEMQAALQHDLEAYGLSGQPSWRHLLWPLALALALGLAASYAFARWSRTLFQRYQANLQAQTQALQEREALFRAVFDNAAVGIAQIAPDGKFLQINQQFCQLIGYSHKEVMAQGFDFQRITLPEDLAADLAQVQRLLSGQASSYQLEKRYVHQDGHWVWVNLAVQLVRNAQGEPLYFISAVSDISARKAADQALQLAASVFTHAREGIMITAPDGRIVNVNTAFSRITGYSRDEVLGRNPHLLSSGRHDQAYFEAMWKGLLEKDHWYGEIWNRRKSGELFVEMQTISAVRDAQGQIGHFVALFSDITALKAHEQQLEHMAHFDALTGLPNRVLLADRLHQAMHNAQRRGLQLAVVYLDLDGFKLINDTHGHEVGDQLLMTLAERMKQVLREGDTLARLGGDEFVAVVVDLPQREACAPLLQRLLDAAHTPVALPEGQVQVSASLGVTYFPQTEEIDADQLQRQADQAMYQAKLAGKNRYHAFDTEQDRHLRGSRESQDRIRQALEQGELVLYYQPKVNMRSGQVVGAEALIRWQHPERGLVPPIEFLPAIENHMLMVEVGEWVMHTALTQLQAWQAMGLNLPVSVNVSARQMQQHNFVPRLEAILADHPGVSPALLELEVLETSALEDIGSASHVIEQCQQLGLRFALDDFGTGYSSLTYLKRLPVAQLKIDQSFVRDMLEDPDDLAILKGVIGLAEAFHREVIAEGVETVAHGAALLALGCELGQGYGIARPMPAAELPDWVQQWRPDAAWTSA
ncbi:EAL domain-containing protein [Rhodoferax sp.]|uniref:cache domain-containing protein n=1 Tax=Rhodoferax sp. TaxID=50421 RepID=UPI00260E9DE6|nr:EAL domain-containing protein [Rhodoferax sp.]